MKPIIKVVCGIIWKDDRIFIARRKPEKNLGGFWEFPGGKIKDGEESIEALKRELFEELGMKVKEIVYYGQHKHEYDTFVVDLIAYSCEFLGATFEMTDHDQKAFVKPGDFRNYTFAPADLPFAKRIQYSV